MRLKATIEVGGSVDHGYKKWRIDVSNVQGIVEAETCSLPDGKQKSIWELSSQELAAIPEVIKKGIFPEVINPSDGFDGFTVHFDIISHKMIRKISIWEPAEDFCLEYVVLLKWCQSGRYQPLEKE